MQQNMYVHIMDSDGKRITSLVDDASKPIGEDRLMEEARKVYPNAAAYVYAGDDFIDECYEGKAYIDGGFVEVPSERSLDDLKSEKITAAGVAFAAKRDAHTWHEFDGVRYGYDRAAEDIVNFLAALERAKLGANVYYKVYIGDVETKGLRPHTLEMLNAVLEQSAEEQTAAYIEYETVKARILACETKEELDAIEV